MSKRLSQNVPELRFPEFKGDWTEKKLNEISNKISDGIHSTPQYDENGEYYFINGNNLIDDKIEFGENTKRVNKSEYLKYKSELTPQTILISINGTIGNLAFYDNEKIVLGKSACYIDLNSEENKFFVFYLLQTSSIKNHFNKELTGSTIKNLSLTTIKNTKSLFPSYKEQEKIASFLGAVDRRLTQLRRKQELLQTYKRGVMQKIFSQQIRFKQDNGSDFPNWEETKLGEIFDFKNGINADKAKYGRGKKFINVLDIINDAPIYHESIIGSVEITDQEFENNDVRHGDILFQRSSEIREEAGQSNVYLDRDKKATFGGFVIRGRPKISFNPVYFHNLLKTEAVRKEITDRSGGSTRFNVGQDSLREVPIMMCRSIEEQAKIADFLTTIDRKIETFSRQIDQTEQFKKGLLQKMFV
jgi:type I restriction enzyme S subunit